MSEYVVDKIEEKIVFKFVDNVEPILSINLEPILSINHDGKIYWRGREVVQDKELVAALVDIVKGTVKPTGESELV